MIIQLYLSKVKSRSPELEKELTQYKVTFTEMRNTFDLLIHPNVMPYQELILDDVSLFNTLESCFTYPTIFPL